MASVLLEPNKNKFGQRNYLNNGTLSPILAEWLQTKQKTPVSPTETLRNAALCGMGSVYLLWSAVAAYDSISHCETDNYLCQLALAYIRIFLASECLI